MNEQSKVFARRQKSMQNQSENENNLYGKLKLVHDFENYRDNLILSTMKVNDKASKQDQEFKMDQKTVRMDSELAQK